MKGSGESRNGRMEMDEDMKTLLFAPLSCLKVNKLHTD